MENNTNYKKVLILPFITLISSIVFGFESYKISDDILLTLWITIFLVSILIIVSVIDKEFFQKK